MSYKKGRKAELEYSKILEQEGWITEIAPKGNKFSKQKDFFEYWDIISFHPVNNLWRVSQIKSGTANLKIRHYKKGASVMPENTICELVHRKNNVRGDKKWRIISLK